MAGGGCPRDGDGHDPDPGAAVGGQDRPSRRPDPPRPRAAGTDGNPQVGLWPGVGAADTHRATVPLGVPDGTRPAGEPWQGAGSSLPDDGLAAAYRPLGPVGNAVVRGAGFSLSAGFSLRAHASLLAGSALCAGAFLDGRIRIPVPGKGAGRRRPEYPSGHSAAAQVSVPVRERWTSCSTRGQARGDDAPGGRNGRSGSCHPGRGRNHRVSSWGHLSGRIGAWSRAPRATLLTTVPAIPG